MFLSRSAFLATRFPFLNTYLGLASEKYTFSLSRKRIPIYCGSEYAFLFWKCIYLNTFLPYPLRDLFVVIFLQKSPWTSTLHIFLTTTPNEVIPKPTSSSRWARSVGLIFTMVWHYENDLFALARKQPLWERTVSGKSFRGFTALLASAIFTPRQATIPTCMIVMQ